MMRLFGRTHILWVSLSASLQGTNLHSSTPVVSHTDAVTTEVTHRIAVIKPTMAADETTPGWVLHRVDWALHYGGGRPLPAALCMATLLTRLGSDGVSLGPTLRQAGSWGWKLIDLSGALLSREPERWPIGRAALIVARLGG